MNNTLHGNGTQEFQDFFTPTDVAQAMADAIMPGLIAKHQATGNPVDVLEPSVGSGNLIWPLLKSGVPMRITCLDIQQWCLDYVEKTAVELGYSVDKTETTIIVKNF